MTHSTAGAPHTAEHHHPPSDARRWTALALVCLAQFMLILDVTVVNVALPDMASDLHLGRESLTWVVTAYTLCFGGLMLLGGRLADALGARRTLLAGLALFTAASLVSGLAENAPTLLGGRIGQGVGAALLSPAALSLVTTTFHGPERTKALGVWAAIGGTGSAAGVLLGGALTDGPGWPWVFYINVRMFTRRPVLAGAFLMLIATALLIAFFFLGSAYLQYIRGFSPLRTGMFFLPVAVATGAGAHLGSRLVGRIGSRPTAVAGMAVAAAGTVPLTRLTENGSVYAWLLPGFVTASLGIGAVFVTATTTALAMVEHREAGLASGVVNTFHEVGGSVGVAVVSTVAAAGFERGAVDGFADAFTLCAVAAAAAAVVALGLVPRGTPQPTGGPYVH
ncbi:MFS transporter [Streptomyces griseus]|uniref:MFS transporter n=1 Tax=Streptomyces griseus TaxID=1911 RepID=UPI0005619CBE|nr:MFS transporter [Streptomyces griseus]